MQPWNFLVVRSAATKARIKDLYLRERQAAACFFDEPRRSQYLSMKLEGICEAAVNVCVTCDPTRGGTQVLGRNSQPETDVYSTCLAVQNIWLAARSEGLGVGWGRILKGAGLARPPGRPAPGAAGGLPRQGGAVRPPAAADVGAGGMGGPARRGRGDPRRTLRRARRPRGAGHRRGRAGGRHLVGRRRRP